MNDKLAVRNRAQAQFIRSLARLEVQEGLERRCAALEEAEIAYAQLGRFADEIQGSFVFRLFKRGPKIGGVIMGASELEAMVQVRRNQLERFRTVVGPERIDLAEDLASVMEARAESLATETLPVPSSTLLEAGALENLSGHEADEDAAAATAFVPEKEPPKPNGRRSRSPWG